MQKQINWQTSQQFLLIFLTISFEYFIFTLFIVLSREISNDLIPTSDSAWRQWYGLSVFLVAGLCRPLGGLLFTGMAQSPFRQRIFYVSALIMALTSIVLALLPSAKEIGVLAPLGLILMRALQGFVVGAAIPEAIVFCYERANCNQRMLSTNLINMAIGGGFLSAMIFAVCAVHYFAAESWRVGMLSCGIVGLIASHFLRNAFYSSKPITELSYSSLAEVLKVHKLDMLRLVCFCTFLTSGAAVFFYIMPGYLRDYYHYSEQQSHLSGACLIFSFMLGLFCAMFLHSYLSKNFYISSGLIFKALLVLVFHSYLQHNLVEITLLNSLCCFIFGFFTAKFPAMMVSTFPVHLRYAGVAIIYNIGFGVMFGVSHFIVLWLIQMTNSLYTPSLYIIFFSYISLISLWFMKKEHFSKYRE